MGARFKIKMEGSMHGRDIYTPISQGRGRPKKTTEHATYPMSRISHLKQAFSIFDSILNIMLVSNLQLNFWTVDAYLRNSGYRADMVFMLKLIAPNAYYISPISNDDWLIVPVCGLTNSESGYVLDTLQRNLLFERTLRDKINYYRSHKEQIGDHEQSKIINRGREETSQAQLAINITEQTYDVREVIPSPTYRVIRELLSYYAVGGDVMALISNNATTDELRPPPAINPTERLKSHCRKVTDQIAYERRKLNKMLKEEGFHIHKEKTGPKKGRRLSNKDRLRQLEERKATTVNKVKRTKEQLIKLIEKPQKKTIDTKQTYSEDRGDDYDDYTHPQWEPTN
jgi:hypothetical protein